MSKFSVGFSDVLYETKRAGDSRLHNPIECWRIKESGNIIGYIKNRDQAFAIVDVLNAPPIPADKVMVPKPDTISEFDGGSLRGFCIGIYYHEREKFELAYRAMIEAAKEG